MLGWRLIRQKMMTPGTATSFLRRDKRAGEGLVKPTPSMRFLPCRAQVFQTDFNDNYARYQQASAKQALKGRQSLMRSSPVCTNAVPACACSCCSLLRLPVWFRMSRWVITRCGA